jgi:hypothetical protein
MTLDTYEVIPVPAQSDDALAAFRLQARQELEEKSEKGKLSESALAKTRNGSQRLPRARESIAAQLVPPAIAPERNGLLRRCLRLQLSSEADLRPMFMRLPEGMRAEKAVCGTQPHRYSKRGAKGPQRAS